MIRAVFLTVMIIFLMVSGIGTTCNGAVSSKVELLRPESSFTLVAGESFVVEVGVEDNCEVGSLEVSLLNFETAWAFDWDPNDIYWARTRTDSFACTIRTPIDAPPGNDYWLEVRVLCANGNSYDILVKVQVTNASEEV